MWKNIWAWFNGKKTAIGAVLIVVAGAVSGTLPTMEGIGKLPALYPPLAPFCPYVAAAGFLLGGAGGFHKILKAVQGVVSYLKSLQDAGESGAGASPSNP